MPRYRLELDTTESEALCSLAEPPALQRLKELQILKTLTVVVTMTTLRNTYVTCAECGNGAMANCGSLSNYAKGLSRPTKDRECYVVVVRDLRTGSLYSCTQEPSSPGNK